MSLLPTGYAAESLGEFQTDWLDDTHPHRLSKELLPQLQSRAYLPSFSDFLHSPPYEALIEIASVKPYHDVLEMIATHSFFFLIHDVGCVLLNRPDAPLPHIIYEDIMKVFTFSSLQNAPERHFQLSPSFRLLLLSSAAHVCLKDPGYLTQARRLYRRMEQQQSLNKADYSAMVWIEAAGRGAKVEADLEMCMHRLVWMQEHGVAFDPKVFAFLQHPSVDPVQLAAGLQPHTVKGLLAQVRLAQAWDEEPLKEDWVVHGTSPPQPHATAFSVREQHHTFSMGVHAVLVHLAITVQPRRFWTWSTLALEREAQYGYEALSHDEAAPLLLRKKKELDIHDHYSPRYRLRPRTLRLLFDSFVRQQGRYCTPQDVKALFMALLRRGPTVFGTSHDHCTFPSALLFILMRMRRNEVHSSTSSSLLSFTEEELVYAQQAYSQHAALYQQPLPLYDQMVASASSSFATRCAEDGEKRSWNQLFRITKPLIFGFMSSSSPKEKDGSPSTSSTTVAAKERWKTLLWQCAAFSQAAIPSVSPLDEKTAVEGEESTTSDAKVAKGLFQQLMTLDMAGREKSVSRNKGVEEDDSHMVDDDLFSVDRDAPDQGERVLEALQKENMSISQQFFTRLVVKEEEEHKRCVKRWNLHGTELWTSV